LKGANFYEKCCSASTSLVKYYKLVPQFAANPHFQFAANPCLQFAANPRLQFVG
jgi:hypothetical protein